MSGDGEGEMEGFQRGGLGLGAGGDGWAEAAGSGRGGLGAGTSAARGGIGARGGEGGGDEEDDDALEKTAFGRRLKRAAEASGGGLAGCGDDRLTGCIGLGCGSDGLARPQTPML